MLARAIPACALTPCTRANAIPILLERNCNLVLHLATLCLGHLHQTVRASRVQHFSVNAERQAPTAALVSPCPPHGVNMALAIARRRGRGIIIIAVALFKRQSEGLNVARSQTNRHDRLLGVDSLGEQVRGQRKRADRIEHGGAAESRAEQDAARARQRQLISQLQFCEAERRALGAARFFFAARQSSALTAFWLVAF